MAREREMKIYFFHLHDKRWIFFASPEIEVRRETVEIPVGMVGTWLLKLQRLYTEALAHIQNAPGAMWRLIRRVLHLLERFVHPDEALLRAIGAAESIEIVHPEGVSVRFVERRWRRMLRLRRLRHSRGIVLNLCLLPVTAAATLIPGPNVFVAWNGFRLYSHVMARRGADRALDRKLSTTFLASDRLRRQATPEHRLSEQAAAGLEQDLNIGGLVDYLYRLKWFPLRPAP